MKMPKLDRRALFGLALTLSLAAGPALAERPNAGCSAAPAASGIYEMPMEALSRTYRLHVPAGSDPAQPAPLTLLFHGWGEDENYFFNDSPIIAAEADRLGFVIAAPRGLGSDGGDENYNSWTFRGSATGIGGDGQKICSSEINYAYKSCGPVGEGVARNGCSWTHCQGDDKAFVLDLIAEVERTACIDLDRVFLFGGSNGGMFAWDMGQSPEVAGQLRAMATLIGLPHRGYLDGPGRADGLPVLSITGTDDPTVPPGAWGDESPTTTNDTDLYHYTGASAITNAWAKAQGCTAEATKVNFGGEGVECRSSCSADASGLPPVLDCRAKMAHDYNLPRTWPMVLDFFSRQPPR